MGVVQTLPLESDEQELQQEIMEIRQLLDEAWQSEKNTQYLVTGQDNARLACGLG